MRYYIIIYLVMILGIYLVVNGYINLIKAVLR
jgi:hypothetical protein